MPQDRIFELRNYTLKPGRREELIELFAREFVAPQNAAGAHVVGWFRDLDEPDHFVWMRSFESMAARRGALEAFYGGPVWKAHREAANATMIDSDDVYLLHPAGAPPKISHETPPKTGVYAIHVYSMEKGGETAMLAKLKPTPNFVGAFATEESPNSFPALPVRDDRVFAVMERYDRAEDIRAPQGLPQPEKTFRLEPGAAAGETASACGYVGAPGDFDFLEGAWSVTHRKLKQRLVGSKDWDVFSGTSRFWSLIDGVANVDDNDLSSRGYKGASFRALNLETKEWSIYWVDSRWGVLTPPVIGGFRDGRGEFYGDDVENGRPVLCRFIWTIEAYGPRWEQAFSVDDGESWEVNWIMEFRRAR